MSQDIADMPGIEAAVERFNAMDGTNGTNATDGTDASATNARTDARADTLKGGHQASATREPRVGASDSKANAGPAAEPLPHGRGSDDAAQNSVTSKQGESSALLNTDTPAAADSQVAGNDKQQRDAQGRFTGNGEKQTLNAQRPTLNAEGQNAEPPKGGTPSQSRFAKAQERLEKTWEAVNKRKGELDTQASALEQQRHTLERDKTQFEAIRRQAEQPQATPEQANQAAQLRRRDADALRMQAKRAEEAQRFDEAKRLNKQADKAEGLADDLAEYAEQLRRNPPVSMQQRQQQFEQARKQWTVEACNAFPELNKNGSRLQQVVAQHLNALAKEDPQLLVHPSLIYHVARLADAQVAASNLEAVAARVPVLEKEAESLRARIKELEASVTPAGDGGVPRLNGESKDDYASLRQSAVEIGHGRW